MNSFGLLSSIIIIQIASRDRRRSQVRFSGFGKTLERLGESLGFVFGKSRLLMRSRKYAIVKRLTTSFALTSVTHAIKTVITRLGTRSFRDARVNVA